ncbi:hypothetical protein, partial [Citrobacter amalonaticus]|uniref:hypothetical protein n=1 Tax=Citrobacter amalonaticus TaxID=35703 RepID=UPI004042EC3C
ISALCSPKNNTGIFATREFDVISSVAASIFAAFPKPTFEKMHIYRSDGMIMSFLRAIDHAYRLCTCVNK